MRTEAAAEAAVGTNLVELARAAMAANAAGHIEAQESFLRELARRVSGGPLSAPPPDVADILKASPLGLTRIARRIAAYVDDCSEKSEAMAILEGSGEERRLAG